MFLRAIFVFFTAFFLIGCGYKPASVYANKTIGDSVYVFVEVYASDPENSVIIKDAVYEAVLTKFRSKLTTIDKAKAKMSIKISSITLSPIQYDKNGYVVLYRMNLTLSATIIDKNDKTTTGLTGEGSYDFSVQPGASLPDITRFNAIQNSATKALDMLLSSIAIKGAL